MPNTTPTWPPSAPKANDPWVETQNGKAKHLGTNDVRSILVNTFTVHLKPKRHVHIHTLFILSSTSTPTTEMEHPLVCCSPSFKSQMKMYPTGGRSVVLGTSEMIPVANLLTQKGQEFAFYYLGMQTSSSFAGNVEFFFLRGHQPGDSNLRGHQPGDSKWFNLIRQVTFSPSQKGHNEKSGASCLPQAKYWLGSI